MKYRFETGYTPAQRNAIIKMVKRRINDYLEIGLMTFHDHVTDSIINIDVLKGEIKIQKKDGYYEEKKLR